MGNNSPFDWVATVSGVVAAIAALITLVTVYAAAMQILTRRQLYRLGVSPKSLGPWKSAVVTPSLFRMQTQISTPTISLPRLVGKKWVPKFDFPSGFNYTPKNADPEDSPILAEASWVNFIQALGITPADTPLYELQYESELVNGIVPMRWKGSDLVGICSMLGFQSNEEKPDFKTPMPLPSQWSGPLGWLQFRASSDGCIVEFRRRAVPKKQLSREIHDYYESLDIETRPLSLVSRLLQSINAMRLPGDEFLYLGGTSKGGDLLRDRSDDQRQPIAKIFEELTAPTAKDRTDEELKKMMWGKKSEQPGAERTQLPEPQSQIPGLPELLLGSGLEGILNKGSKESNKMAVMHPCTGLLSVILEGEFVVSRGLQFSQCCEYYSVYTDPEEVNQESHPYRLGRICMNEELLVRMKKAILLFEPDGFYFSPTKHLAIDVTQIWNHVDDHSDKLEQIFLADELKDWKRAAGWDRRPTHDYSQLYHAMVLCNEFQNIRRSSRAMFAVADMQLISKASVSLRQIITPEAMDLVWAMIVSPDLFTDLVKRFGQAKAQSMVDATLKFENGWVDCSSLPGPGPEGSGRYRVPLVEEGEFSGTQVLAAFLDVFLTYFWIKKAWISNVGIYDVTIPQSVTMC